MKDKTNNVKIVLGGPLDPNKRIVVELVKYHQPEPGHADVQVCLRNCSADEAAQTLLAAIDEYFKDVMLFGEPKDLREDPATQLLLGL